MFQFDDEQRYARLISLPEMGAEGLAKLRRAKIALVGMGGLGCPAALYLTASGIGTLGLIDHDRVALSNLGRQVLFETADIGRLKTEAARDRLEELNPEVILHLHSEKLEDANAEALLGDYDIILDGSDNAATRYLVNAACHRLGKPLISAAIHGWEGHLYAFHTAKGTGCYRCLFPDPPLPEEEPRCADSGVFSPLAGMMGSWQAAEAMKWVVGLSFISSFYRVALMESRFQHSQCPKDDHCPVCSIDFSPAAR